MKGSVVCLLYASLMVIVLVRGNDGLSLSQTEFDETINRQYFNGYDKNNDGSVTIDEFRIEGTKNGFGDQIDYLFGVIDKDNDKQISFEEFVQNIGSTTG